MATKRMLRDVATVFVPLGEDEQGEQSWGVYLFSEVSCRPSGGNKRSATGNNSEEDSITLYIFDKASAVSGGTSTDVATTCESIFYVVRQGTPAVDDDTKIFICPYDARSETAPPPRCRKVNTVERLKAGSSRMWHWKVVAK